jgi:hypothetical protein
MKRSSTGMETRRSTKVKGITPDPVTPVSTKDAKDFLPRESWWATANRDEFAARRAQEQARMEKSPFGAVTGLSFVPPGTDSIGQKSQATTTPRERPRGIIGAM